MVKPESSSDGICYQIRIRGELDECWSSWFDDVTIVSEQADGDILETTLTIRVLDQAKLRGILNKIWDLNLTVLSLNYIEKSVYPVEDHHG